MGPCSELIASADVLACCDASQFDDDHPPSDALVAAAAAAASAVAWRLAGRQHGTCTVEGERPAVAARRRCGCWERRYGSCACREPSTVTLGHSPVQSVDDVRVGGVSLDTDAYRLVAPNRLLRVDGARWPTCQQLAAADDDADVLVVDYTWGATVDADGRRAIGVFACELVKACLDRPCQLPQRVTSIVRQGVALTVLDPMDFLDHGRTGVYALDQWLAGVNPGRLHTRSRVRTPDITPAVTSAPQGT